MQAKQSNLNALLPWGIALLRIVVGLVFFMHGQQKLFEFGIGGVEQMLSSLGVPAPQLAAIVVSLVETVGGLALIAGVLTRIVAGLLVIDMLVALVLVHWPNGFFAGSGGIELVLLLAAASLTLVLTGPGALAVDNLLPLGRPVASGQSGPRSRQELAESLACHGPAQGAGPRLLPHQSRVALRQHGFEDRAFELARQYLHVDLVPVHASQLATLRSPSELPIHRTAWRQRREPMANVHSLAAGDLIPSRPLQVPRNRGETARSVPCRIGSGG